MTEYVSKGMMTPYKVELAIYQVPKLKRYARRGLFGGGYMVVFAVVGQNCHAPLTAEFKTLEEAEQAYWRIAHERGLSLVQMPDGEPIGPFATEAEALADAQSYNA